MQVYKLKGILQKEGWLLNPFVTIDDNGKLESISTKSEQSIFETLDVFAVPGFQNAHSHAFQYAMAGLAEVHTTTKTPDDFWSWRDAMYQLALQINPDDLEHIATMLYAEMLRHGYTNVAEFHYVHHDKNGNQYNNLSEMGERLVIAAKKAGIGITLIPIFYQKGGFGKAPSGSQKRFLSTELDDYLKLLEASEKSTQLYANANVGIGIHSMRGVEPKTIIEIAKKGPQNLPFHIHVSEQLKEIEDSLTYLGKRPVEWMLENIELNERFHLVHATHLSNQETIDLAKSGSNVVLCPSTEGNLGDGIFPLRHFQEEGGKWSIGTDSHIGLNPFEEFRILDYGQRLTSHKRNTFYSQNEGDSGRFALNMALISGRKAMNNFQTTYFSEGDYFDAVLIDANAPLIATSGIEKLLSTITYATDISTQYGTFSKGKLVVKNRKHQSYDKIRKEFVSTLLKLKNRN